MGFQLVFIGLGVEVLNFFARRGGGGGWSGLELTDTLILCKFVGI